jgi:hypothetical protein
MKHFGIGLLTGFIYALLGFIIVCVIVYVGPGINLSCRDCQGAAGALLMILAGAVSGLFMFGLATGVFSSLYFRNTTAVNRKIALVASSVFLTLTVFVCVIFAFVTYSS